MMDTVDWVFRCMECGKEWWDPEAPVTGHYCNWQGHGIPPEDMEESRVKAVKYPDSEEEESA